MTVSGARPRLFNIAWPILAELLLGYSVGVLGLWLASGLSDTSAAAFALSNHVQNAFFLLFRIVSMGVSVVITQNIGAGNRAGADQTARAALGASTWLGLGVLLLVWLGAGQFLGWMNAPELVLVLALPYLQALALPLLLDAYNASMSSVMRAHLRTRDVMLNILAMHGLHLLLCYPLMRGWGPFPGLGLPGFAVAMVLSRIFGVLMHLWLWRWRLHLVPRWKDWWHLEWQRLGPVLHIGLPGAAENVAYRVGMLVSMAVVSGMGAQALATHSYTSQVMFITVLFSLSIGLANEILVGHLVGAGRLRQADKLLRKSLLLGCLGSLLLATGVALSATTSLRLFTQDESIIRQASTLLWITVLLEPGRSFNLIVINALRAAGDARFPVAAGAASMLLVMAGGSWLLGVHFGLGLAGVWIAYTADEWIRGLLMAARWHWRGWLPHARVARRRARGGDSSTG
jgi:putative MATE family efflux protein